MRILGNGLNMSSVALGAGAILLAPVVIPIVGAIVKPLAKAVIKGSLMAYEGAKLGLAETKETIEDIAAEAKAEITEKEKQA